MPSLNDAVSSASNLSNGGYVESDPVEKSSGPPTGSTAYDPGRNSMIRCPLPPLWQDSSDSQRQFYMDDKVPQMRIMTPQTADANGALSGSGSSSIIENNSGGGGGIVPASISSAQAVVTTPVLPPNAKFTGALAMTKSFQLLSIAVGSPARIQFYGTAAAQTQDSGRGLDVPPPAGVMQNIIADVVLDTGPFQWSFQDRVGANADQPQQAVMYVTVTNLDGTSDSITLTLQYVPLESV